MTGRCTRSEGVGDAVAAHPLLLPRPDDPGENIEHCLGLFEWTHPWTHFGHTWAQSGGISANHTVCRFAGHSRFRPPDLGAFQFLFSAPALRGLEGQVDLPVRRPGQRRVETAGTVIGVGRSRLPVTLGAAMLAAPCGCATPPGRSGLRVYRQSCSSTSFW